MNKKKIIITAIVALVVIFAVISLSIFSGSSDEQPEKKEKASKYSNKVCLADNYIDALPEKPLAVVRVQADKMLEKSEILKNSDMTKFYSDFKDILSDKMQESVDAFIANPSSAGIDLSKPVYAGVYMSDSVAVLATASVSDKMRLIEVLNSIIVDLDYQIVEQPDGLCYVADNEGERIKNVAFDNKTLLVAPYGDVMDFVAMGSSNLSKDAKYSALHAAQSDVAMMSAVDNMLSPAKSSKGDAVVGTISKVLADASMNATLDFVDGGADGVAKLKLQEKYKGITGVLKGATGKHMEYIPSNAIAILNFKADINVLYNMLPTLLDGVSSVSMIDNALEMFGIDKSFINTLSTEYSVAVLPAELVGEDYGPRFILAVENPDREIFDFVLDFFGKDKLEQVDKDVYALGFNKYVKKDKNGKLQTLTAGNDYYIAYRSGTVFLVPQDVYRKCIVSRTASSSWFSGMKGKEVCLNSAKIKNSGMSFPSYFHMLMEIFQVEAVTVDFDDVSHMTLRLDVSRKDCNMLKSATDKFCANFLHSLFKQ